MSATFPGPTGPRLCTAWVFSNNSDVHVAKDREWFVEYHPFETFTTSYMSAELGHPVVGIGVVEVPVKRFPNRSGANAHGKLRLENVLHSPDAVCNILAGVPLRESYQVLTGGVTDGTQGRIDDLQGRRVAYFYTPPDGPRFFQLKLSGPPTGPLSAPSCFRSDGVYMINAMWPAEERQRWLRSQVQARGEPQGQASPSVPNPNPAQPNEPSRAAGGEGRHICAVSPYTEEEKEWLKNYCGSEIMLLRRFGLNIHKEEDREEGRAIVRAIMRQDEEGEEEEEEDQDKEDDFMRNPEGHMADHHFSDSELDFIRKNWGDSTTFMLIYGLKFYDDDDCEEAKAIVAALMSSSDDEEESDDAV